MLEGLSNWSMLLRRMKRQNLKPIYVTWILNSIKVAASTICGMGAGAGCDWVWLWWLFQSRHRNLRFQSSFAKCMKEKTLCKSVNHQRYRWEEGILRGVRDADTPTTVVISVFSSLLFTAVSYGLLYGVVVNKATSLGIHWYTQSLPFVSNKWASLLGFRVLYISCSIF